MDLILAVVQLLKRDINRLVVEAWDALEPVKLQNKGQPSYIVSYVISLEYGIYNRVGRANRATEYTISQAQDYVFKGPQSLPK